MSHCFPTAETGHIDDLETAVGEPGSATRVDDCRFLHRALSGSSNDYRPVACGLFTSVDVRRCRVPERVRPPFPPIGQSARKPHDESTMTERAARKEPEMSSPVIPGGGLAEALNILLDKGLVIDASIRVTVIGIELLALELRVVIASVDTYIRYLESMQRLQAQRRESITAASAPVAAMA